jgi:predicted  nucleic acid-binding Zn-ribbon protein
MINDLELKDLPFVDGVPDADQQRIQWIRNGDCIEGSKTKYGHDGNMNAPALGVQTNVLRLEENSITTKDKLNEVINNVNIINEAIAVETNTPALTQIELNRKAIIDIDGRLTSTEIDLAELNVNFDFLRDDVGYHDFQNDGPYKTVRENIILLKREIGHYANQDINGDPLPEGETNDATGMKRRIIDNTTAIVDHGIRIETLERDYSDSDVGSMNIKLNELRTEMGPKTDATGKPAVYTRLDTLETKATTAETDITGIKSAIGYSNVSPINTRVNNLESSTAVLTNKVDNILTPRITKIETDIGTEAESTSINGRLSHLRIDVDDLYSVVGRNSSTGLRYQVTAIDNKIGADVSPAAGTINRRLNDLTTQANASTANIQNLQAEIGTNSTGLKGTVLSLKSVIEGTNPNGVTVEERGLLAATKSLEIQMTQRITDAPSDGKTYARRDALWIEVPNVGTEIDAVKASLALTDGKVATLGARVDANDTSIAALEIKASGNQTSIGEVKADIVLLKAADTATDGKIAALETKTDSTDTDVTALALDVTAAEGKITTLESGLAAVKVESDKVAGINTRLGVVEGKVGTLETGLAAVKVESDKVAGLTTRLTAAEGKITALETELAKRPPEAPATDGLPYVLVDNAWVLLSTFVTLN